jgi:hypothetical protein
LRPLFVFAFSFFLDTPAGLEAFLCCPRALVAGGALCGLNSAGGSVRGLGLLSASTCDRVFMRLVGAVEAGALVVPRGGLGFGEESGVRSGDPGEEALREALERRGVDCDGVVG